jgi:hypothetical protein
MDIHLSNICRLIATLFLVFSYNVNTAFALPKGEIRGIVVDENGHPMSQVKVNARPLSGPEEASLVRYVETDSDGRFLIDRLDWGKYAVFAMKEESGYPNLGLSLYSNDVFPTVTIGPQSAVAELRIQLGPKAGIVAGSVINAENGGPLNTRFEIVRAAFPGKWLYTSAPPEYRILIPSGTDVLLRVTAPGFRDWSPPRPLNLLPGAEVRLDIALEPAKDPNLHPSRFLVPSGFVGWLLLNYNVKNAQPVPTENDVKVFRFPADGALETSSTGPDIGAADQFFYYLPDGSLQEIRTDYRNGEGMIWGQHQGSRHGTISQFGFFVGTERQYKKYQMRETHPGLIRNP